MHGGGIVPTDLATHQLPLGTPPPPFPTAGLGDLGLTCLPAFGFPSRRYLKLKRDEVAEKQDEETVDVTPIMICVFVVMCCSMLVLLYFFYDYLGTIYTLTTSAQP